MNIILRVRILGRPYSHDLQDVWNEHIQLMFWHLTNYYMKDAGHGKNLIYNNKP